MVAALVAGLAGAVPSPGGEIGRVRGTIRQELLARINRDRIAHSLSPVSLDERLSSVADRHCERQIREGTVGHYTLDGLAPYARYSQAGVNDAVAENAVAWSANYAYTAGAVVELAHRSHEAMMNEAPPKDSHRRTILDPFATHVAIGSAWEGGELRLIQLFVRRHIEWTSSPRRFANPDEVLYAAGRARSGWRVAGASLHRESLPGMLSVETANRIESYALPAERREFTATPVEDPGARAPLSRWAAARRDPSRGLSVRPDGSFSFSTLLSDGPGIYTLVVWLAGNGGERVAASHVSTIVREPRPGTEIATPAGR